MEPITFPEHNRILAKDQPPYLPLPVFSNSQETISCWRLTWRERLKMLLTGTLWLRQLNFNRPLQPQAPTIHTPFTDPQL